MENVRQSHIIAASSKSTSLFRNSNFLYLWSATLFSSFALALFTFSQTWYIVKTLNLQASLGLVLLASSVPRLVFMIVGGAVADKFPKKNIMFISNMIRIVLVSILLLWLVAGDVTLYTLVIFALCFGLADAFFWSADGSILPELVAKHRLTQANSITQMTNQSSLILGPVLAGFLLKVTSYEAVFALAIVLLISAAFLVYHIKSGTQQETRNGAILTSIKEGILYVKQSSFLTTLLICSAFLNLFLIGPMQIGFPIFVKNVLQGDSVLFSYLEGSVGGGMAIGAITVGLLNIQRRRGLFCIIMLFLSGIAFFFITQSDIVWQALLASGLFGIALAMAALPLMAVIQSTVKEDMMGRVMSLMMLSSMGLIPLSYAATSMLLTFGIPIVMILKSGAVTIILFALFVALRVPTVRRFD
ncbi:MFS transporter [Ectobacillus antri]|uniref:MFS transporter n=1 Tax=Ectobacillus antri TaxID=2486280 RepID=A0ABT6H917_9BACI|nr:MFS transporter [Ectobacillus antri]MDG4658256.1 MFS transporter [Ectobacillus antri]MDG5755363.1 MFS transporter [Ectobacillus antri]